MMSDTPGSFGYLLNVFRKRRHLTQKHLAAAVGVHRNAIGRWEQGDFLPATRGIVLELARHLMLDESETRQLLEASLIALSPYWLVPFPRNPFFTGREEILEALHAQLGGEQVVALTQSYALHGLGGVGKTQTVLEYAYRHALEYSAIFWIGAETSETVVSNLMRIAEVLQLPEREDKDQQRVLAAVQHWLTTHSQWLLIWDNVEDLAVLDRFLPAARAGAILLTTRSPVLGTLARGIDLWPMEHEEGMLLLLRRAKVLAPEAGSGHLQQLAVSMPGNYAAAEELVQVMDGLPLALDQAGAYIEETGGTFSSYLRQYERQSHQLLDRRGKFSGNHPHSVVATLELACQQTAQRNPAALELLRFCVFLASDAIPEELFVEGAAFLGPVLARVAANPSQLDLALATLRSLSLVHRHPETQTLSLHRLVQAVLQSGMSEQEQAVWQQRVIRILFALFPEVTYETWGQCERLLPHVLTCASAIQDDTGDQELADVLRKAADYLRERAQYAQAESLYRQALHIREQGGNPEHPWMATPLKWLAYLYYEQGKYEQAEPLYQQALRIREQAYGPEHYLVAELLEGLAMLSRNKGKYAQAEQLLQRALYIREQTLGAEHPQVAFPLNSLALLYGEQGKYEQAKSLYERALRIREQTLGRDHHQVATVLNNLGEIYREQGKYAEAERLFQRALRIRELALGSNHPQVAESLNGLANIFREQGKYAEAESLYQRGLRISEQSQGSGHPDVAIALNGLATLYSEQGEYAEAEVLFQRALSIREQHLGQQHPETAQTLHDLAISQQKQGNLSEALSFTERALAIRSQSLGNTHPDTVATRTLYAQFVQELACAKHETPSALKMEEFPGPSEEKFYPEKVFLPLQETVDPSPSEDDPLQGFLAACCELHPRAWSRSRDLWQAYERWVEQHHEHFPLSRSAFIAQLKAHDCRADRTKTARIWRGIALVNKDDDGR
ncbi:MAG: FxSxx-COOH system tetratricopeptide repeat protein [Chloroflexota bacterium]|nr:FxSxx-COOH system tetratricopeptide repeat protein [Chloroflexota bacterium]